MHSLLWERKLAVLYPHHTRVYNPKLNQAPLCLAPSICMYFLQLILLFVLRHGSSHSSTQLYLFWLILLIKLKFICNQAAIGVPEARGDRKATDGKKMSDSRASLLKAPGVGCPTRHFEPDDDGEYGGVFRWTAGMQAHAMRKFDRVACLWEPGVRIHCELN